MEYIDLLNELIANLKKDGYPIKKISDTHHTFEMLYFQRMIMFAIICNTFPELSFKSRKHFDETNDPMFNDDFIAGINTPKGITTFHFKLTYWDLFSIKELDKAPKYDNYSPSEALERLSSLLEKTDTLKRKLTN